MATSKATSRIKAQAKAQVSDTGSRKPVDTETRADTQASTTKYPKDYPHRVTLDISEDQYEGLRKANFDTRKPKAHIVRELIDQYLADPAFRTKVNVALETKD